MGKESACNAGDTGDEGLIPGWGRFPGEGNGNPLQYPCLENSVDGVAWQATVHRVAKSQIPLSDFTHLLIEVVSIYTLISSVCSSFFGHSPPQNVMKVFDLCHWYLILILLFKFVV